MKNLQKFFSMAMLMCMAVALLSCSKDEEEVIADRRSMVEGTYNYNAIIYHTNGSTSSDDGKILITKSSTGQNFLQIDIDSEPFIGSKIVGDETGLLFDLEPKNLVDDEGDGYEIAGVPTYSYEGVKYHGFYDATTDKLTLAIKLDYINNDYDSFNAAIIIEGKKK